MWVTGAFLVAVLVIWYTYSIYKWRNPKCNGVPPPGSMGLPLIGETLELLIPSYSIDIHPFIKKRITRFGPIFRTNIFGHPLVMSADPELNSRIFQGEGKTVELFYTGTFNDLLGIGGKDSTMGASGAIHKYIRTLVLTHFGTERLKAGLFTQIGNMVDHTLRKWSTLPAVEVKMASSNAIFQFTAKHETGCDEEKLPKNFWEKFRNISQSFMSIPIRIPGTKYYRCAKDKEEVLNILKGIMEEKRSSPETRGGGDVFDHAIADLNTQSFITEDFAILLIFVTTFVSFDSVSSVLPILFKCLAENPAASKELEAEHEALLKRRKENHNSPLSWDEYKSLTFTPHVINECLRLASLVSGIIRRALVDINVKGYTIPAGWMIMSLTHVYHLNPDVYKDPLVFNPWRWKDIDARVTSKNFMPFGGGGRQCAGAEFAKAFLASFIHVLVTKYRWTKIMGGKFYRNPMLSFGDGIHIKIMEKKHD